MADMLDIVTGIRMELLKDELEDGVKRVGTSVTVSVEEVVSMGKGAGGLSGVWVELRKRWL